MIFLQSSRNTGLVKMIIVIVIALLLLAYFGFNLRSIVDSPTFQDNWAFIRDGAVNIWNKYLKGPVVYLWNEIFVKLIWNPAIDNLTKMKDGKANDIQSNVPLLPYSATSTP